LRGAQPEAVVERRGRKRQSRDPRTAKIKRKDECGKRLFYIKSVSNHPGEKKGDLGIAGGKGGLRPTHMP